QQLVRPARMLETPVFAPPRPIAQPPERPGAPLVLPIGVLRRPVQLPRWMVRPVGPLWWMVASVGLMRGTVRPAGLPGASASAGRSSGARHRDGRPRGPREVDPGPPADRDGAGPVGRGTPPRPDHRPGFRLDPAGRRGSGRVRGRAGSPAVR